MGSNQERTGLKDDSYARSLPLRYKVFPSRRTNMLACPCLLVILHGNEIVRLLDPELGEGFISAARIFVAAGIALLEALARFDLKKPEYDLHLGNLAPFDDIWIPLVKARNIATDLGILDSLAALLEWDTRLAWSLDDGEEGGMLHNWKIPQNLISPSSYSSNAMQSVEFDRIVMLQQGSQLRTPLDRIALQTGFSFGFPDTDPFFAKTHEQLLSISVTWMTLLYEEWLECDQGPASAIPQFDSAGVDATFLFRTLVSANTLTGNLPASAILPERRISLANGKLLLGKENVVVPSLMARLALVDGLSRLFLITRPLDIPGLATSMNGGATTTKEAQSPHDKILEHHPHTPVSTPSETVESLQQEVQDLHQRIKAVETVLSAQRSAKPKEESIPASSTLGQIELLTHLRLSTLLLLMIISFLLVQRIVELSTHVTSAFLDAFQRLRI